MTGTTHDAFISYRQASEARLASALERGLEQFAKPLFRLRVIDVFRDKTGLAASPGLLSAIESHLEGSRWFVYLASPDSAASPWCLKELEWWLDHHGTQRLLVVVANGELVWPPGGADFDWTQTTALPEAVRGRWLEEPLWVDLRWTHDEADFGSRDARLRPALLDLASAIRGVPKDLLDGEDVREQRMTRRLAGAALGLIVLAAALAVWQAIEATRQRDWAIVLRDEAQSRQLAAQSGALLVEDPVRALQLAAQSRAVAPTVESDGALLGAVALLPLSRLHQHRAGLRALATRPGSDEFALSDHYGSVFRGSAHRPGLESIVAQRPGIALYRGVNAFAFAPDGQTWAYAGSSRTISVRQGNSSRVFEDGDKIGESTPVYVLGLAFSPDGRTLASVSSNGSVFAHDLDSTTRRLLLQTGIDLASVAFSPDGTWLVVGGDRGLLQTIAVASGARAPLFKHDLRDTVHTLSFAASGQRLFAASRAGQVQVFDSRNGTPIAKMDAPEFGAMQSMAVSADGQFVVTGYSTGAVVLWQAANAEQWPHRVLLRHAAAVAGLSFGADGRTVISASSDGRLFVTLPVDHGPWQPRQGRIDYPVKPPFAPRDVRSPDGRWIAVPGPASAASQAFSLDLSGLSLSRGPRLSLFSVPKATWLVDDAELPGGPGAVVKGDPVFAADGALLALQVADRLALWDLKAGRALDALLPLPVSTQVIGALPAGAGWLASTGRNASEHFVFVADPQQWSKTVCTLAARALTREEWRRYMGIDRAYEPVCR